MLIEHEKSIGFGILTQAGMGFSLLLPDSLLSLPSLVVAGFNHFRCLASLRVLLRTHLDFDRFKKMIDPQNRAMLWPWSWSSALRGNVIHLPPGF